MYFIAPDMRIAILGRVDDTLLVKGVNVFPSTVRDRQD